MFVALLLVPARALAEPPADTIGAIVHVDAYEHNTLGAVVGDGRDVLVPFAAIEVDRPGAPDATVIDRSGARVPATLVATDRASGLALLRVGGSLTDKPLAISSRTLREPSGLFLYRGPAEGAKTSGGMAPSPAPTWRSFADMVRFPSSTNDQRGIDSGAPIVDPSGGLVALAGVRGFDANRPRLLEVAPALARLRSAGQMPRRRPWIFYGGGSFLREVSEDDAGIGAAGSLAVRWRDLVEARLDASLMFVFAQHFADCSAAGTCQVAVRGVLTPSIGPRIRVGGLGGLREDSIAITPSAGLALGVENGPNGLRTTSWALFAPGVAVSMGAGEIQVRVRVPRADVTVATVEVAAGFMF